MLTLRYEQGYEQGRYLLYSACSLAKSELRVKIMVALPVREWTPPFKTEVTCHVTPSVRSLFHEQK